MGGLLSRFSIGPRPVARVIEETMEPSARLAVKVPAGTLRIRAIPGATEISVRAEVRSRDSRLAEQIKLEVSEDANGLRLIAFAGPFTTGEKSAATVDVSVEIPAQVPVSAHNALGDIKGEGIAASCRLNCAMGNIDLTMGTAWIEGELEATARMGNITLGVPAHLPVKLSAATAKGKTGIEITPREDGVPVNLRVTMGNIAVREIASTSSGRFYSAPEDHV